MTLPPGAYQYPAPAFVDDLKFGILPVDFILETIIKAGLQWFLTDPTAPLRVFGHLTDSWLAAKYGEAKAIEIRDFLKKYGVTVVQHFSLIDQQRPCISIQLLDGSEREDRAGLSDFSHTVDNVNLQLQIVGREEIGYTPVSDSIQIGCHVIGTPDLAKYLYYLVTYILSAYKPELEQRGMHLGTFRATDISRLNEYLPEQMFSRFINFSYFSIAYIDKGLVPIVNQIIGMEVAVPPTVVAPRSDNEVEPEFGVCVEDVSTQTTIGGLNG